MWDHAAKGRSGLQAACDQARHALLVGEVPEVSDAHPAHVLRFLARGGFVVPHRVLSGLPGIGPVVRRLTVPRLKVYGNYPFQVAWADWFDRLAAPIRFYYNDKDLDAWLKRSDLGRTLVSRTGLFGWRAYGERSKQAHVSTQS